jgi:hypothetical protein
LFEVYQFGSGLIDQGNIMSKPVSLNQLWHSVEPTQAVFEPAQIAHLPEVGQRYLKHAIAPGTTLARAVRLRMQGEIKLKQWQRFQAEEVISWEQGMIWQATAWLKGLPIKGWDRVVNREGGMQWKLLGLIPVMRASGTDVTRSAIGRMQGECIWLPSVFCYPDVEWTAGDDYQAQAQLTLWGETTQLKLRVDEVGRLQQFSFERWGNPESAAHHYVSFGGYVEEEGTFSGYTIPTRFRVGWYFGSEQFESEGEFFRATIDEAVYR